MNIIQMRQQLMAKGLSSNVLKVSPYQQFEVWNNELLKTDWDEPSAMIIATVDEKGQPWQRTVLLKSFDDQGFVFFTNYRSRKAQQIALNAKVSLLFPWHALGRQVKITGIAIKITPAASLEYFLTRPRGSRIGAWASRQSQVISSRALLDQAFEEIKSKFQQSEIPLPSFWGGYRIIADSFEFWQARDNRLHDCFFYQKEKENHWSKSRLAP